MVISMIVSFTPLIGGIISFILGIWFSVFGMVYAIGLYEMNVEK
jgi:hypothetical protein